MKESSQMANPILAVALASVTGHVPDQRFAMSGMINQASQERLNISTTMTSMAKTRFGTRSLLFGYQRTAQARARHCVRHHPRKEPN